MRLNKILLNRNLSKLLDKKSASKLDQYAKFTPSPVSISHFLEFGKNASSETSYLFMRKEIPVRLANIMKELELLPEPLQQQSSCCMIQDFYVQSFQEIVQFENAANTSETRKSFTATLASVRDRHRDVVPTMAEAVMAMKGIHSDTDRRRQGVDGCIQYFLDRLYMSRISIHMLINQHTMIFGRSHGSPDFNGAAPADAQEHVGCIDPVCDLSLIVKDAFSNAAFLCEQLYMEAPELKLKVINACDKSSSVQFVYVPAHLYHILFEVFKNALRATVESHEMADSLPDVEVLVVKSNNDVTVKISDQGGGIPRNETEQLFHYLYSTAPTPSLSAGGAGTTPMAGLGYGLPLSRLYARYFHGDLILSSQDGFGTDATVYLRALANEASELLPVYNKTSKDQYSRPRSMVADWTDPTANLSQHIKPGVSQDNNWTS